MNAHEQYTVDVDAVRAQASADWSAQPTLRGEFGGNKAAYLAYVVAEAKGRFRVRSSGPPSAAAVPAVAPHAATAPQQPQFGADALGVARKIRAHSDAPLLPRAIVLSRVKAHRLCDPTGLARALQGPSSVPGITLGDYYVACGLTPDELVGTV